MPDQGNGPSDHTAENFSWCRSSYQCGDGHHARAAGRVTLTRRRDTRQYAIREVAPEEAGPVLKRYVRIATATRRYFLATKNSPVQDFVTEADRHPVFELTPVDENRQTSQPAR